MCYWPLTWFTMTLPIKYLGRTECIKIYRSLYKVFRLRWDCVPFRKRNNPFWPLLWPPRLCIQKINTEDLSQTILLWKLYTAIVEDFKFKCFPHTFLESLLNLHQLFVSENYFQRRYSFGNWAGIHSLDNDKSSFSHHILVLWLPRIYCQDLVLPQTWLSTLLA